MSWMEEGPLLNEYDDFLKWQAQFVRFALCWVTHEEEDRFSDSCTSMLRDLTAGRGYSWYFPVSEGLSAFLRRNHIKFLFSESGSVKLTDVFAHMHNNSRSRRMSGHDFAAMLLANNKSRFFAELHVHWQWNPRATPPTEPWEIRLGCPQGHSNQTINPYKAHHVLTPDEAGSLGWIFHVTS